MLDFCEKILKVLDIDPSIEIKRPIRGLPGITAYALVYSLIHTNNLEESGRFLGYASDGAVKSSIRMLLLPKFPNRHADFGTGNNESRPWKYVLLALIEHKECNSCKNILPFSVFNKHSGNDKHNLTSECAGCQTYRSKLQKEHIKNRTPSWANLNKIKEIYVKCPIGYHVDHIIPLRGTIVSGLHVENNLQYLLAEDNQIKSNRWV